MNSKEHLNIFSHKHHGIIPSAGKGPGPADLLIGQICIKLNFLRMKNGTKRIYHIKDGVLKEHGNTVLKLLPQDIGVFADFDTTFSQQTIDDLSSSLTMAEGEVKDETLVAGIKGNTQTVTGLMQQCHKAYNRVSYFVDKAFSDNEAVQGEFRMGELHEVSNNQLGMIDVMESIAIALNKYAATLIENGMSQDKIDAIVPLAEQLKNSNAGQEVSKDERPMGTQSRVGSLNELFRQLKQISDAAPMVFEDNEAKMKAYRLPAA